MAKIALIHTASDNPSQKSMVWPPLGLCRISSYLKSKGHEVHIIEDALEHEKTYKKLEEIIHFDLFGFSAMTLQYDRAYRFVYQISDFPKHPILVGGGAHFLDTKEEGLFDAIVSGDGEIAIEKILNGERGIVVGKSLKEYQPISFDDIQYSRYGDHLIDGSRAISIITSRGCPFRCNFCASPKMGGVVYYPINKVVQNIVDLSNKYNIKNIRVMDDSFTVESKRVKEFCKIIKPHNMNLACLTHISAVRPEDCKIMKEAGFNFVAIGVESANYEITKLANKGINKDKVLKAVSYLQDAKIEIEALFMIGLPGETKKTAEETLNFAKMLKKEYGVKRTHFQFFTPFPGSKFTEEIRQGKHGFILNNDWNKFDHRRPVFLPNGISHDDLVDIGKKSFQIEQRKTYK